MGPFTGRCYCWLVKLATYKRFHSRFGHSSQPTFFDMMTLVGRLPDAELHVLENRKVDQ